ncbi:MAG: hypothetical protein A3J09_01935 [Candidatus Zambryskibacteria bacterium RIFCSPLOWO2_02_FULL_51_21]|uniref:DUF2784 domain-containing protein n=1 Tax=Candidatus Zambryskibacteria bacterium RIFCSPHIGHO2_02_FULL_43_37 TaxID=1802749 RepID=A0A1G2TGL7_9BACT|nr:MAG: hypothetical protein A2723_01935 [Candidatus Zambryskibacteria bacterium RIFCSPHIGHO2_01_FULL_52_18]OHA96445.1 MAG: hypothetical protein A3D49_00965 [Candidatus Zambryskibacteria bacterium RIFCSPHIGHO2_02_FULL_43_37]OHB11295.1 MAG: hypothetical protein A3J09_01935 [Candidatus Zambryskibacteria bacterium RIFCSPLOWO2_02_FULL_51_21]
MNYIFLANATAVIHASYIVAVIVGLLVSYRYKRFRPWEALILISTGILWSYYGNCPLTILEQWLREQAGQSPILTQVGFTTFYLEKLFSIHVSSIIVQRSTLFASAMFFGASIEWFAPFFHYEVFKFRKLFRRTKRKFV